MKKRFTRILAALALLVFMIPFTGWGQSTVTFDATTDITGDAQAYQTTVLTINAADGSVWTATGYGATANTNIVIGKGGANYLKTPVVEGTITSVAVTWSGNANYYLALQTTSGTELEAKSNPSEPTTETYTVTGNYSQLQLVGRRSSGSSNAAATITDVVVTYTPGSVPQPDTYTVSFDAGEGTFDGNDDFPEASNEVEAGIYSLPSATREGYTMLWSDGEDTYEAGADYEVTEDVDFTAQWTENTTPTPQGVTDVLNRAFTGYTSGTSYYDWSGKTGTSGAVYAGNSAGGNNSIQLRSSNSSGIVSTTSGGKVMKVEVEWESHTTANRVLQVYGKNTAYESPDDLYNDDDKGTLLGTIICDGNSTSLNITGDYEYVGLRSASGAMYLSSICITWGSASALAAPAIAPATHTFVGSQEITITAAEGASIRYTLDGSTEPTATTGTLYEGPFTINNTTTVKAIAFNETASSEVTTVTYTREYNITLVQTTGGVISASAEQAAEGAEVTLTATANVGYTFNSWTVSAGTLNGSILTMPANDVTVSATFVEATAYTVSFSINNNIEMTATVNGGDAINLSKFQAVPTVEGYSFAGWSTTPEGEVLTGSYTPSAGATLYAQFGEVAASGYSLVTSADELVAGDQIVIAANGDKNWAMSTTQNENNRGTAILTKNNNGTITIPEGGDINGDVVCQLNLGTANNHWTFQDPANDNGYLYAASSSKNWLKTQTTNDANGEWVIEVANNGEATITAQGTNSNKILRYNSGSDIFSCYASGQQTVWLYRKPAAKLVKGNRDEVAAKATVTDIAANVLVTVKEDGIVYLTGDNNGNAANLVVEDGGQLVASANVQGTMLKSVTGYTGEKDNYYLISNPLNSSTNPEDVLHMINTAGYDLYRFDQNPSIDPETGIGLEWRNYKVNSFNLTVGSGYLYANSEDLTLEFAGTLAKGVDATSQKSISYQGTQTFAGWNLVGNPFPCNAAVNMGFYKMKNTNDGISTTIMSANDVIAPMEGVFVQATEGESDQKVTFTATTDAVTVQGGKGIALEVNRDNEMLDRAIVGMNEGSMVSKLRLSSGVTELYIPQGDKDYALVGTNGQGELPVNFKASRNATYTISANAESMEMTYLHLIDNMTGADVDLLATPSYTFEAKTSDYASRFRLVFKANGTNENNAETFAYFNGTNWTVSNVGEATLQVVDVTGRTVANQMINGNAELNLNQPAGVYVIRLVNGDNVKTQKVVVR